MLTFPTHVGQPESIKPEKQKIKTTILFVFFIMTNHTVVRADFLFSITYLIILIAIK